MAKRAVLLFVPLLSVGLLQGQAPSFTAAGFVNSASSVGSSPPAVARGELVTIFGTILSTSTQFIPLGSPNPTQIPGSQTRVVFGNIDAPLAYVSPTLVNVQVPFELPEGLATVDVRVKNELGISEPVNIQIVPMDPGVFSVLTADGMVLGSTPVTPGEILHILVNGVGDVLPHLASGTPAPVSPIHNSVIAPSVTINGVPAAAIASTLYPGLVGVYLVKVKVPEGVSGPADVVVTRSTGAQTAFGIVTGASGIPYSVAGHTIISGGFYSPTNAAQAPSVDGATATADAILPTACKPSMTISSFVNTGATFRLFRVSPVAGSTNWSTTGAAIISCNTGAWSSGGPQTCTAAASSATPAGTVVTLTSNTTAPGGFLIGFSCE